MRSPGEYKRLLDEIYEETEKDTMNEEEYVSVFLTSLKNALTLIFESIDECLTYNVSNYESGFVEDLIKEEQFGELHCVLTSFLALIKFNGEPIIRKLMEAGKNLLELYKKENQKS